MNETSDIRSDSLSRLIPLSSAAAGRWRRTSARRLRPRSSTSRIRASSRWPTPNSFPSRGGRAQGRARVDRDRGGEPRCLPLRARLSLASGRVVEVKARLGDTVKKGQLLLKVRSADISGAFSDYRQAVADETLAKTQLERARSSSRRERSHRRTWRSPSTWKTKARVSREAAGEAPGPRRDRPGAPAERDRRCLCAHLGRHRRAERDGRRRRQDPRQLAQPLHHREPRPCLDHVRRIRERFSLCPPRRLRGRPPERLPRQGVQGAGSAI